MTTNSHANCDHAKTKSARAACRKDTRMALIAGDMLYPKTVAMRQGRVISEDEAFFEAFGDRHDPI